MTETPQLGTLRRLLLLVLAGAMLALVLELVLLEHFDSRTQYVPFAALALALPLTLAVLLHPRRRAVQAFRLVMLALVVTALLGLYFHYTGNVEFELETDASLHGWALLRAALQGATPALAPGSLAFYGAVGLIATYQHPALRRADRA